MLIGDVIQKENILHFTHIDSDAVGCDVLLKYLYHRDNIKTYYIQNKDVDEVIVNTINEIAKGDIIYNKIFITDIGPTKDTMEVVVNYCNVFGATVYGFDHHKSNHLYEDYNFFVVADSLLTLSERYKHVFNKGKFKYHYFVWEHDNYKFDNSVKNHIASEDTSMKISATYVLFRFIIAPNKLLDGLGEEHCFNYELLRMVGDISCYDTWEWKNNPYIDHTGKEDKCQKLVKMVGISEAVNKILYCVNHTTNYFPVDYDPVYEYQKYKGFEYVKRTNLNTKVISKKHIGLLEELLTEFDGIETVYLSVSDNSEDINEEATFVNKFLDGKRTSMYVHIFCHSCTLSFRSPDNGVDVSKIAERLCGGGHKNAAGVVVDPATISQLLLIYHEHGNPLKTIFSNEVYESALAAYARTLTNLKYFKYDVKKY